MPSSPRIERVGEVLDGAADADRGKCGQGNDVGGRYEEGLRNEDAVADLDVVGVHRQCRVAHRSEHETKAVVGRLCWLERFRTEILRDFTGHRVGADLHRLAEEEVGRQHLGVVLPRRRSVEARPDRAADGKGVAEIILAVELEHGRAAEAFVMLVARRGTQCQLLGDVGFGSGVAAVTELAVAAGECRAGAAVTAGGWGLDVNAEGSHPIARQCQP